MSLIKIAIVDDHALFRKGLIGMIQSFSSTYSIHIEAENGVDLLSDLHLDDLPDLVIMDISMPKMDGFELTRQLSIRFPELPILVVSMIHQENAIIRMLRLGVKGYVSKDIDPEELHAAIENVVKKQYHYTDFVTGKLIHSALSTYPPQNYTLTLTEREIVFLRHASSEDTYQQIADKMFLSIKTIDGYRASLFDKFRVKSRTGLVLYGIKNGLISLE